VNQEPRAAATAKSIEQRTANAKIEHHAGGEKEKEAGEEEAKVGGGGGASNK
jgi:hypothetical protein